MSHWLTWLFMVLQCVFNFSVLHRLSKLEDKS